MEVTALSIVANVLTDVLQPIFLELTKMSQVITDLQAAVAANTQVSQASAAELATLKQKLDAAVAANAALTAQLATAQAGQADPADAAAIIAATTALQATNQSLTDANAVNSPAN